MRVFRRLGEGMSPELEIGRFLVAKARQGQVANVPSLIGGLELRTGQGEPITVATLHRYVANEGTAWKYVREELRRFYERALTRQEPAPGLPSEPLLRVAEQDPPEIARELMGGFPGFPRSSSSRRSASWRAKRSSTSASIPCCSAASPPRADASTDTSTSPTFSTPARTSSSSTSRATPRGRCRSAAASAPRCGTWWR